MVEAVGVLGSDDEDVVYLYLPLAHSFALLIQLVSVDLGVTIAYFGGDTKQIVAELIEVKPTYLPSVPRIFEKIYTLVTTGAGDPAIIRKATEVGMQYRKLEQAGQPIPDELQGRLRPVRREDLRQRARRRSAAGCARPPAARRRSRRRSSSSSTPPASRCSRATA